MASLDSSVNEVLNKMHQHRGTEKGSFGEQAVFKICENFYQHEGGILIHSYSYKVDRDQAGNIKKDNGRLFIENLGSSTEIDVLYISKYRVFPIEVKAYAKNGGSIVLTDDGIYGNAKHEGMADKSPVHQNEMHCRHLYAHIFRALPDGSTEYIIPIVCMVDKAKIEDQRSDWQREYIKLTILNTLEQTIRQFNTPLQYQLNLTAINNILKEQLVSSEVYLPPRF